MRIELIEDTEAQEQSRKRQLRRVPGDAQRVVLHGAAELSDEGEVIDESFGGIGLRFDGEIPCTRGDELEVSYNGVQMWAVVKHVTRHKDGSHMGLEWKAVGLAQFARMALARIEPRNEARTVFRDTLPSGFYMMWRLFETKKWRQLGETAERLGRLASQCEAETVVERAAALRESTGTSDPGPSSRVHLDALMEECIRVATS